MNINILKLLQIIINTSVKEATIEHNYESSKAVIVKQSTVFVELTVKI